MSSTVYRDRPVTVPISIAAGTSFSLSAEIGDITDATGHTAQIRIRERGKDAYHITKAASFDPSSKCVSYNLSAVETGVPGRYEAVFIILNASGTAVGRYPQGGWMLEIEGNAHEDTLTALAAAGVDRAAAEEARDQAVAAALSAEMGMVSGFYNDAGDLPSGVADDSREYVWTGDGWQLYEYDLGGDTWTAVGGLIGSDLAVTRITSAADSINATTARRFVVLDDDRKTGTFQLNPSGNPADVDDALVLASAIGTWDRVFDDEIFVDWFGAHPDNADNTVAIATAIAAGRSRELTVSAMGGGSYIVKGNVLAANTTQHFLPRIDIRGQGRAGFKIKYEPTVATEPLFAVVGQDHFNLENVQVQGIDVGIGLQIGSATGFASSRGTVRNCMFQDLDVGVDFQNGWIWDFISVGVNRCDDAGYYFGRIAGGAANAVNIIGGHIEGNAPAVPAGAAGIKTRDGISISDLHVGYTTIEGWYLNIDIEGTSIWGISFDHVYHEINDAVGTANFSVGQDSSSDIGALSIDNCSFAYITPIRIDRVRSLRVGHIYKYAGRGDMHIGPNCGVVNVLQSARHLNNATFEDVKGIDFARKNSGIPVFKTELNELDPSTDFPLAASSYLDLDTEGYYRLRAMNLQVTADTSDFLTGAFAMKVGAAVATSPGVRFECNVTKDDNGWYERVFQNRRTITLVVRAKWSDDSLNHLYAATRIQWFDGTTVQSDFVSGSYDVADPTNRFGLGNWMYYPLTIDVGNVIDGTGFQYVKNMYFEVRPINSGSITVAQHVLVDSFALYRSDFGPTEQAENFSDALDPAYMRPDIVDAGYISASRKIVSPTILDLSNLPTSDPAVAGEAWSNSGVVTISSG